METLRLILLHRRLYRRHLGGIYPTAAIAAVNGSTYRQSIYLKAGTHRYVEFYSQSPSTAFVDVDLQTCNSLEELGQQLNIFSN